jgi:PTS system cellobiose-specific IIA component
MQNNEKLEEIAMMIISNSGAARSQSFEALNEAKKGNFDEADKLLKSADNYLHTAHESHRELLKMDAMGEVENMGVLLAHAQDHLMSSTLAKELIKEIICLYKK